MVDERDDFDEDDEAVEVKDVPSSRGGVKLGAAFGQLSGFFRGITIAVLFFGAIGLFLWGTRYELGGSLRETYKINRLTGDVAIVSGGKAPYGTYEYAVYFLRPEQIKFLKKKATQEKRDVNEVVREAVDSYLEERGTR
ncbi:MAG: hypothetical protein VYA34_14285 [Myxococcota bacterium]|nr:hypothetical protein [Myxococcota bacterium]